MPTNEEALEVQKSRDGYCSIGFLHGSQQYKLVLLLPYEREARVAWSVETEGVDNLLLRGALSLLDGEHRGEDEDATHEAHNVVHQRSDGAEPDSPLRALHEGGKGQESPKTST